VVGRGSEERVLSEPEIYEIVSEGTPAARIDGKRVLVLTPDGTRTAPLPTMVRIIDSLFRERVKKLDYMVALGSHRVLSQDETLSLFGISRRESANRFASSSFFNHRWDIPGSLIEIGRIDSHTAAQITEGMLEEEIPVEINRKVFEYDLILILGPVFPHEVMGFSGGFKYLFPGISGGRFLHLFHWLGALNTCIKTIGRKDTPTRRIVQRAAGLLTVPLHCISMVVGRKGALAGLYVGDTEEAWAAAVELSARIHILHKAQPFPMVVGKASAMYDELWTAGKVMYKLEPVVEDGGKLIIYGNGIKTVSHTWGSFLERIGYHVRDYYLAQMDKFRDVPRAVLAHSTHVKGLGSFVNGREKARIDVVLATGISERMCERINLGYMNPADVPIEEYRNRSEAFANRGILYVEEAGEVLYRLRRDQ